MLNVAKRVNGKQPTDPWHILTLWSMCTVSKWKCDFHKFFQSRGTQHTPHTTYQFLRYKLELELWGRYKLLILRKLHYSRCLSQIQSLSTNSHPKEFQLIMSGRSMRQPTEIIKKKSIKFTKNIKRIIHQTRINVEKPLKGMLCKPITFFCLYHVPNVKRGSKGTLNWE